MKALVLTLLVLGVTDLEAFPVWRLSDSLGRDRGSTLAKAPAQGWALRIETTTQGEARTLFHDGREDSLRLLDLDAARRIVRWQDLRQGVVIWDVTFDPATGLPLTEATMERGIPIRIASLEFENRVLVGRTVRTPEGSILYKERLYHWPDGSLRRLEREGPGVGATVSWRHGPRGTLTDVWIMDEEAAQRGERREVRYLPGKKEEDLVTEAGLVSSRVTEWLEAGKTVETTAETLTDRRVVRTTDSQGRLVEELVTDHGSPLQTQTWKYDDQGRLVETSALAGGHLEIWTSVYSDDTVESTLIRDGVLTKKETSRDGETLSVRWYDKGNLFLEEAWDHGRRVKETYYQKGQIIRERTR